MRICNWKFSSLPSKPGAVWATHICPTSHQPIDTQRQRGGHLAGLDLSWKVHSFYPESNMYLHAKDESPVFPEIENPIFLTSSGELSWPHLQDHAWWPQANIYLGPGETFWRWISLCLFPSWEFTSFTLSLWSLKSLESTGPEKGRGKQGWLSGLHPGPRHSGKRASSPLSLYCTEVWHLIESHKFHSVVTCWVKTCSFPEVWVGHGKVEFC